MKLDDVTEFLLVRVLKVEAYTTTEEGRRKIPLSIAGHDDDREMATRHGSAVHLDALPASGDQNVHGLLILREPRELGNLELCFLQHHQEIIGKIDVGFVELI